MNKNVVESQKKTKVLMNVDVAVAGGGPAGWAAAVAAAKNGADTVLVERYGFLFGMVTGGYFCWMPCKDLAPNIIEEKPLVGGIAQDLMKTAESMGGAISPADAVRYKVLKGFESHTPTDPEIMKIATQQMALNAGTKLLLHSFATDVVMDGDCVKGFFIENKSGRQAIIAKVVIDATGDGDIAVRAGCDYEQDPPQKALEARLMFSIANVNLEKAKKHTTDELVELQKKAIKRGELPPSVEDDARRPDGIGYLYVDIPPHLKSKYIRRKEVWSSTDHLKINIVDGEELTKGELISRREAIQIMNFYRKYVDGFQDAYLSSTAVTLGLRESRRIISEYLLTGDDVENGRKFNDVIARGIMYEHDLREPSMPGPPHDIPYRCLVPKKVDGLLITGRCISIDSAAAKFLSPRNLATCMATGQAAGTAAALAIKENVEIRNLSVKMLQSTLIEQGANLGQPEPFLLNKQ